MGLKSLWVSNAVTFTREIRFSDSAEVEMFLSLIKDDVCWGRMYVCFSSLNINFLSFHIILLFFLFFFLITPVIAAPPADM